MKKGEIIESVRIESMAAEGKCVARIDGKVLFVEGVAPGDVVDVALTRIKSSYLEGEAVAIRTPSENRTEPFCSHFGTCGGCKWQHLNYETQLEYKQQQVIDNLERIGGLKLPGIKPIIPSAKTQFYRNRLDFSVTAQRWLTKEEFEQRQIELPSPFGRGAGGEGIGFHVPKSFDKVFDIRQCYLQPDPSNAIRRLLKEIAQQEQIPFFDLRKQTGYLRTLTIRTATTGDVMVIVQVAFNKAEWLEKLLNTLTEKFPQITSLNYVINEKKNDTFNDLEVFTWKGNPYITEKMSRPAGNGKLEFRIGPKSFYQTNPDQAEALYKVAWEMADLSGKEVVYDLYTGTGTIANYVAGQAKKVIGLEYIDAAIEDAKVNASLNGIVNTEFFAGDIKDLLDDAFLARHGRPDVVITDPPRVGMHDEVCRMLLKAAPKKIVYVSCNPATQARDLKIICEKYQVTAVQPVDMFPHTMHVENVVSLRSVGQ